MVELVAVGRLARVLRALDALRPRRPRPTVAAALVWRVVARVSDQCVVVGAGNPHQPKASLRPHGAIRDPARGARRRRGGAVLASCGGGDPPPATGARPGSGVGAARLAARPRARVDRGVRRVPEVLTRGRAAPRAHAIRAQEHTHIAAARARPIKDLGGDASRPVASARSTSRTFPRLRSARGRAPLRRGPRGAPGARLPRGAHRVPDARAEATAAGICSDEATTSRTVRMLQGLPAAEGPFVTGAL